MSDQTNLMKSLTQGVYVIGTKKDPSYNLMTAAWLTQISSKPNQIAAAVGSGHLTARLIMEQQCFSISVLADGQERIARICGTQSGRTADKFRLVPCRLNGHGLPVIFGCAAQLYCEVINCIDIGDHILVIAEVVDGKASSEKPLLYRAETYF